MTSYFSLLNLSTLTSYFLSFNWSSYFENFYFWSSLSELSPASHSLSFDFSTNLIAFLAFYLSTKSYNYFFCSFLASKISWSSSIPWWKAFCTFAILFSLFSFTVFVLLIIFWFSLSSASYSFLSLSVFTLLISYSNSCFFLCLLSWKKSSFCSLMFFLFSTVSFVTWTVFYFFSSLI